jgi:predicted enzyme related to lactoylglutathione lyase
MTNTLTPRGVATINIYADDVKAARQWYSDLFGIDAYFQRPDAENPAYVEFRVGDYQHEIGIIDKRYAPKGAATTHGGAVVNWHVDDLDGAVARVKQMGATEYEPITKRGEGFITASVIDPFGNILGLMYNQHYLDILSEKAK